MSNNMENPIEKQIEKVLDNNAHATQPKKRSILPVILILSAAPIVIDLILILLSVGDSDTLAGYVFALPACLGVLVVGLILAFFLHRRAKNNVQK
jgi:hypothetical protein